MEKAQQEKKKVEQADKQSRAEPFSLPNPPKTCIKTIDRSLRSKVKRRCKARSRRYAVTSEHCATSIEERSMHTLQKAAEATEDVQCLLRFTAMTDVRSWIVIGAIIFVGMMIIITITSFILFLFTTITIASAITIITIVSVTTINTLFYLPPPSSSFPLSLLSFSSSSNSDLAGLNETKPISSDTSLHSFSNSYRFFSFPLLTSVSV